MRSNRIACIVLIIFLLTVSFAFAHGGRTDQNGGHKDNQNASGLGSYHYHHGMSAHLHPNGVCAYSSTSNASSASVPSTTQSKPNCTVPNFNVTINGSEINTGTAQYPPLLYKDVTYIPLTSDILGYLNLAYKWDDPYSLYFDRKGEPKSEIFAPQFQKGSYYRGVGISISEVNKGIVANGQTISVEYPVIIYNDVYYLPLSSEIIETLRLTGGWTPESGFGLSAGN